MPSLRRRLLAGTALGTSTILLGAGAALYIMTRAALIREFDNALLAKAATLAAMIEQEGERVDVEFTEAQMAEFERSHRPEYFQVWLADGSVVARSRSLQGRDLPRSIAAGDAPVIRAAELPDGRPGRLVTFPLAARPDEELKAPGPPKSLTLALGRDTLDVDAALASLRMALAGVGVLATVASVGVLAWLVRIGLRPADRLAQEIGGIDAQRLTTRLDPAQSPRELQPIVRRLNEFLSGLDEAFTREKTMTADAAHELRTPLAGLRSTLEVALSRDRDSSAYREAMSSCLTICRQTQTLVEQLLALARLDAGSEPIRRQPMDIERLLADAWRPFSDAAAGRQLDVRWDVQAGLTVETDGDKLRSVLGNLFENAVHYANTNGMMRVQAKQLNGVMRICVSNSGSRLTAGEAARVFDRFWRGDSSREKDGFHCGLGLSLCKTIVQRLGGTIAADSSTTGDFAITVTL